MKCKECGKKFERPSHIKLKIYCSRECQKEANRYSNKGGSSYKKCRMNRKNRCLNCKKEFINEGRYQVRYCSDKCKKEYNKEKSKHHHKTISNKRYRNSEKGKLCSYSTMTKYFIKKKDNKKLLDFHKRSIIRVKIGEEVIEERGIKNV